MSASRCWDYVNSNAIRITFTIKNTEKNYYINSNF